jgi:hypothetical protein
MNALRQILFTTIVVFLVTPVAGQAQNGSSGEGYNAFRLLRSRFIFDPERRTVRSDAPNPRAQSGPSRSSFIALTGTMVTPARTLAFFSGSQPEYSKVISVGETIADFKITSITPVQVEVERAGKPISIPVGRQLPLDGSTTAVMPVPVEATTSAPSVAPPGPACDGTGHAQRVWSTDHRQERNSAPHDGAPPKRTLQMNLRQYISIAVAPLPLLLLFALINPSVNLAQAPKVDAVALPEPSATTAPEATPPETAPAPPAKLAEAAPVKAPALPLKDGILLNFQGASLSDVLNYLSEAAGFVILQEAPIAGTVNVVSRQPVSREEAVDLVNAVLVEKGYVAIRNGRILKIVNRKDASKLDLPVVAGSDPEKDSAPGRSRNADSSGFR